jgi:hypothetical protein
MRAGSDRRPPPNLRKASVRKSKVLWCLSLATLAIQSIVNAKYSRPTSVSLNTHHTRLALSDALDRYQSDQSTLRAMQTSHLLEVSDDSNRDPRLEQSSDNCVRLM